MNQVFTHNFILILFNQDVSNNLLETLAASLGSLTGLRKLNASHNTLKDCPEGFAGMSGMVPNPNHNQT
jgi:Leucine-rich repeat (LRR) protein